MFAIKGSLKVLFPLCFIICWAATSTCKKLDTLMSVSTGDVTGMSQSTAEAPGKIIDTGKGSIQHGHCYSKTSNVTISDSKTQLGIPNGTGDFVSHLINLDAETKYYVKAYISDGNKTVYGKEVSFTTLQSPLYPEYTGSAVENATPSVLEMTYSLSLANIVPAASAFTVIVNSSARTINTVAISGTKIQLTLASQVNYGDVVTVAYTKPVTNSLQTAAGGQAATITAQSVTNNVSAVLPVFISSAVENATPSVLEMTYSLSLTNLVPAASAFTVMINSAARTVSSVSVSGTKVQLTLVSPVIYGDVVTVGYTKPGTNPLQTATGGQAATITGQSVTNNVSAVIPAYVSSVVENATPSVLEMTYSLSLANIIPATSAFTVMVSSSSRTINSVAISGTKVQLTLASQINSGDVVTVSYTKPSTNPLQTASGGQAATITGQSVTNNVSAFIPAYVSSVVENATPSVLEMTYSLSLANIIPATSAFTVMVNSSSRTINSVAISGTKVQLTLASQINSGDVVTVGYTKPSTNSLQTASGGQAATITGQSVINNVIAIVPLYISSVIEDTNPTLLEMTYNLTLANVVPATSSFIVLVNGGGNPVSSVTISSTKVQLTLANPVVYGDGITLAYTKPATNPLQTVAGGQAANIIFQPVTNNCLGIPKVITTIVSNITTASANSGGEIINNGGASVTNTGVCWSTLSNPTITDIHSDDNPGTGSFTSFLSGLSSNTTYYLRAYATNSKGTGYGNELILKTFTGTVKDIENNSYSTVTIGTQIWMAQNLKTTRYNDGITIPLITDGSIWGSLNTPAYCWYNNDVAGNKNVYGALYNWYAVETAKLCPSGWHVPSDTEWNTLLTFLGGESIAGGKLKETGFLHWQNPNTGATNETSFTALPGGSRRNIGLFNYLGSNGDWWSVTEGFGYLDYSMFNSYIHVGIGNVQKESGLSVRCIQGVGQGLPTISTTIVSSKTTTTATSGGNISSDGGASILARGVCWSTSPNPTADGYSTDDGPGTGVFISNLTGLAHGTTYYVRAYATNIIGTAYGNQVSFITDADLPTLSTILISDITTTTANSGGNITDDGGSSITGRGICWNTSPNPTIANNKTDNGSGSGVFFSGFTGLTPGVKYYMRAYATNIAGTGYGNELTFSTDPINVTDVEGNVYAVVRIGSQIWIAENLRVTKFNNGDPITNITVNADWSNPYQIGGYCNYDNNPANGTTYGRLYNWTAINDSRKICPVGWHIPGYYTEWQALFNYLTDNGFGYQGSGNDIAKSLASKSGWNSSTVIGAVGNNQSTNNSSGFTGFPGGFRQADGTYSELSINGFWWTPNYEPFKGNPYCERLNYDLDKPGGYQTSYYSGLSVRCIKDSK
jgi:uncharacterized protein (TIGR02145 family)/uncharacterized repeat protein (TIGR02059 family)